LRLDAAYNLKIDDEYKQESIYMSSNAPV